MSIINIVVQKDRALIGADTLAGYMAEGSHLTGGSEYRGRHAGKLSLLPQFNAALTHRGDGLLTSIARLSLETACPYDFDDAVEMMPPILREAYQQALIVREARTGINAFQGAEIALVGWSPHYSRFLAVRWQRYPTQQDFEEHYIDDMVLMPEIDRVQAVEAPDTDAKMEKLVREQLAWAQREHPEYTCGGRLLMAELRLGSQSVRELANLDQAASEPAERT